MDYQTALDRSYESMLVNFEKRWAPFREFKDIATLEKSKSEAIQLISPFVTGGNREGECADTETLQQFKQLSGAFTLGPYLVLESCETWPEVSESVRLLLAGSPEEMSMSEVSIYQKRVEIFFELFTIWNASDSELAEIQLTTMGMEDTWSLLWRLYNLVLYGNHLGEQLISEELLGSVCAIGPTNLPIQIPWVITEFVDPDFSYDEYDFEELVLLMGECGQYDSPSFYKATLVSAFDIIRSGKEEVDSEKAIRRQVFDPTFFMVVLRAYQRKVSPEAFDGFLDNLCGAAGYEIELINLRRDTIEDGFDSKTKELQNKRESGMVSQDTYMRAVSQLREDNQTALERLNMQYEVLKNIELRLTKFKSDLSKAVD